MSEFSGRHHTIPKFLLRWFTLDSASDSARVWCLDKTTGRPDVKGLGERLLMGAPIDNKSPASFVIKSGPGGRNRCLEAAEPSTDRLLRRAHPGRGPAVCGRSLTAVSEELAKRRNG